MKGRHARWTHAGFLLASLIALSGCGISGFFTAREDPTRFYVLAAGAGSHEVAPIDPALSVGLGPIELPEYLLRPELVIRTSATELQPSAVDRWSEPLSRGVTRVLAQDLAVALGLPRVSAFPWYSTSEPDFQVRVIVNEFESSTRGEVKLTARWEITRLRGTGFKPQIPGESAIVKQSATPDTAAVVAAQSEALAELAGAIASAIRPLCLPAP